MQKRVLGLSALFLVETPLVELHDSIAVPSGRMGWDCSYDQMTRCARESPIKGGVQGPSRGNSARLSGCGWDRRQALVRVAPF